MSGMAFDLHFGILPDIPDQTKETRLILQGPLWQRKPEDGSLALTGSLPALITKERRQEDRSQMMQDLEGSVQKLGPLLGGLYGKYHNMLGSILGPPFMETMVLRPVVYGAGYYPEPFKQT